MSRHPRVALFADSFFEVNGAAQACRQFEAFARRNGYDFLSVHCGPEDRLDEAGPVRTLQLRRGKLAFQIDRDLSFDPLLIRRRQEVLAAVQRFRPDVIHITSPGDIGILGAWTAHVARVPLAAAWHTNLHEFAGRRLMKYLRRLPGSARLQAFAERWILDRVLWFFSRASVTFAPNQELVNLIAARSHKPAFLMTRGIDLTLFTPARRVPDGGPFTLGFVGRVMPEKNVRFLATLEERLLRADAPPFRFLVVGDGTEAAWLKANLRQATFTGILTGEALAQAYAQMDLFVFPSQTDTFGNVVLEAFASGVPAVVTARGGPKYLVDAGVTGMVADNDEAFVQSVLTLMNAPEDVRRMGSAARERVRSYSWDHVFRSEVYVAYQHCLQRPEATSAPTATAFSAVSRG